MADATIHGIDIEVSANAGSASAELRKLAQTLSRVNAAGSKLGLSKANKELKSLHSASAKTTSALSKVAAAFKRIVFYRAIRSAIKAITDGFREGLKNAYQFSKINNGALAQSLDTVATKSLTMKNQLGAAFGGLLTALTPIILSIINLIIRLANALSMLFAALGGQGQFKKAKDVWTEWGDAAAGAGGAAKEALKYLAPFDELNVLPDDKTGGGGGGGGPNFDDMFDYEEIPEWLKDIQDFAESFKITFNDVIFDWSDLTGEQITEKIIAGLGGLLGAGVGFMIGGVPGAIVGTLIGVGLGIEFGALTFDHNGVLDGEELKNSLKLALNAITGGMFGFMVGGPGGALIGASIGFGASVLMESLQLLPGVSASDANQLLDSLVLCLNTLTGATLGFKVGGPMGALIGAVVTLGITMIATGIGLDPVAGKNEDEIRAYIEGLDEQFKDKAKPGTYEAMYYQHFRDYATRQYRSAGEDGSQSFWEGIQERWNALKEDIGKWFREGAAELRDNISLMFTGMDWQTLSDSLNNAETLIGAWFADIPAKLQNLGIQIRNAFVSALESGVNSFVEWWNSTKLSDRLGKLEPVHFELIPELSDEELNRHLNEARKALENDSKDHPIPLNTKALIDQIQDELRPEQKIVNDVKAGLTSAKDNIPTDQKAVGTVANFTSRNIKLAPSDLAISTVAKMEKALPDYNASGMSQANRTITAIGVIKTAKKDYNAPNMSQANRTITAIGNIATAKKDYNAAGMDAAHRTIASIANMSSAKDSLTAAMKQFDTSASFNKAKDNLTVGMKQFSTEARFKKSYDGLTDGMKQFHTQANFNAAKNGLTADDTTFSSQAFFNKYSISDSIADGVNMRINTTAVITKTKGNVSGNLTLTAAALGGVLENGIWSSIPQYASGTTRAHGSLFVAGEAGPEVVGHIGGRTEVLNRSQLAATMYASVRNAMRGIGFHMSTPSYSSESESDNEEMMYRAFSRALADSGLDGGIELDGEVLYRKMVSRNKQNTRLTGVNAMAV